MNQYPFKPNFNTVYFYYTVLWIIIPKQFYFNLSINIISEGAILYMYTFQKNMY